ncbi:ABC transporter ATP-binding protein [Billgrantia kenyensis]|uniref:Spermidine/putrescine import ATP-binding protein PotA n=1 Tax=Billgrantia kenyensis TaxID=321266 RepID=A0A7W0AEG7_9GAMM|nr:ABC transporter ATP-binding protein [Halomonas kenyensis]MBA2779604.1 ABC transporter ATP-binding protein [Halomonas kenyensis]MCG6662316.1 ABC transporter ATP-binding protein [Halomonas kenyensis]
MSNNSSESNTHPSPALITFEGVQKSYDGETLVVKDLNLTIRQGEFVTLLGPSGSGKTTCLMMLAGFEVPTSGDIFLREQRLNSVPPHKRNFGMVFQNYALFPHMTVEENIRYPLKTRKMPTAEADRKVARILDMIQLRDFAKRRPTQLSGGQQQRVALARSLVFEPQLVLMDEPLGALDKQLREQMQLEIKHLHERLGLTVVFVTHDQSEALTMSDRVAVFNDGVIQQIDTPSNLYEHPSNAFVAQFIGENNTLAGRIETVEGRQCRVSFGDGFRTGALIGPGLAVGDATRLSIRPERVKLNGASQALPNRLQARVKEFIYLGDHLRVRCELAGNDDFIARVPVDDFESSMQPGDVIELGWRDEDVRALDAS